MPIYDYITVDEHGVQIHGFMEAADPHDLKRKAWKEGHFLVSWRDRNAPAHVPPTISEPPKESEPVIPVPAISHDPREGFENTWRDIVWAKLHTPAGIAAAWILLIVGAFYDRSYLIRHAPTIWAHMVSSDLQSNVGKIRPGVKRAWVEQVLTQKLPGQRSTSLATYLAEPKVLVMLTYDATGGAGSPDNKVTSYPEIKVLP